MFKKTNTEIAPWIVIRANRKTKARIEVIQHILETIPYKNKNKQKIKPVKIEEKEID